VGGLIGFLRNSDEKSKAPERAMGTAFAAAPAAVLCAVTMSAQKKSAPLTKGSDWS
jgi:hypothetical protein